MLSPAALIDRAQSETGLAAFGDDLFREGLERLVAAIESEARLHAMGETAMEAQIVDLLSTRLQVENWYKRFPEIDEEEIVAPLIGLGLPRTGSTALACLLGEDPAARSLRTWESTRPCPPPNFAPETVPERIALAEASMERRKQHFPRMQQLLPSTATSPTECQLFMGQDFKSQIFQAFAFIPSYVEWLEHEADLEPTYVQVKRVLKLLQWRGRPMRWRLKNPAHSLFIDALFKVFPDAKFVMTHRDIAEVIPSVADVYHELSSAYSEHADKIALAALNAGSWELAMRRMIAFRDAGRDRLFFDIPFGPFMRDPFPELEGLYGFIGEELTEETRVRMAAWRAASQREKPLGLERDPAEFGVDLEALRERFGFYRQRFTDVFARDGKGQSA